MFQTFEMKEVLSEFPPALDRGRDESLSLCEAEMGGEEREGDESCPLTLCNLLVHVQTSFLLELTYS